MTAAHTILASALPEHLTPKTDQGSVLIVIIFLVSITVIALARLRQQHVFLYLIQGVFAFKPLDDLSKEAFRPTSPGSLMLTFLYMLVSSATVYWLITVNYGIVNWKSHILIITLPFAYLLYQLVLVNLAARIMDKADTIAEINYFTLITNQLLSIILLGELFLSYFQNGQLFDSMMVVAITFALFQALRFVRGFWLGINQGISWYYIILYFWTLEILPLLILVKVLYFEEFHL